MGWRSLLLPVEKRIDGFIRKTLFYIPCYKCPGRDVQPSYAIHWNINIISFLARK